MRLKSFYLGSVAMIAMCSYANAAPRVSKSAPSSSCYKFGSDISVGLSSPEYQSPKKGTDPNNYNGSVKGKVTLDYTNNTTLGVVNGLVTFASSKDTEDAKAASSLDTAYLSLAGLKLGYYTPWELDGLSYSGVELQNKVKNFQSLSYGATRKLLKFGLSVDMLDFSGEKEELGVGYMASLLLGKSKATLTGGYDYSKSGFAVRGVLSSKFARGTWDVAALFANGANAYYDAAKYSVATAYKMNVTNKLTLSPGVQYLYDTKDSTTGEFKGQGQSLLVGADLGYALSSALSAKVSAFMKNNFEDQPSFKLSVSVKQSF